MKGIIEKLGLEELVPIKTEDGYGGPYQFVSFEKAKILKKQRDELLEALIECRNELAEEYGEVGYSTVDHATGIIEKATGKPWPEIKAILEENNEQ